MSEVHSPGSATGLIASLVVPSPTLPNTLNPQHQPVPSVASPQVEAPSVDMLVQVPGILTGTVRSAFVPSPMAA
ncbi:MAG: hypothetical protein U0R78_05180 [Nocardioidaceae bacterium]